MKCNYCGSGHYIKKGKRKAVQRYFCKECNRGFQESYSNKAYLTTIDPLLIRLLQEGNGVRNIARILEISKSTVLSRMLTISKQIKVPYINNSGHKFEVDELWSFVGNKKNVVWITYAIEKKTRNVVNFVVGRKSKEMIRPLIHALLVLHPKRIYTDKLNIYPSLVPKEIHTTFRYCTNAIERKNLTLRNPYQAAFKKNHLFFKGTKVP